MGTVVERNGKYRAVIRLRGHTTRTKTFSKKALAIKWIKDTEYEMEKRELASTHIDIATLIDSYPLKSRMTAMLGRKTKGMFVTDLTSKGLVAWRDRYFSRTKPVSMTRYLSLLSTILKHAEAMDEVNVPWGEFSKARHHLYSIGILAHSNERTRRPVGDEIDRIKAAIKSTLPMNDIIDFALMTCLREAEICRVRWDDVDWDKRLLLVRDRKHPRRKEGNHSLIPLLGNAIEIIRRQPRTDDRIFPFKSKSVGAAFYEARKAAGVVDLTFHDLRREGVSRLFEIGYSIEQVSLVSGHRDWRSLRIYTKLKPESLHRD